MSTLTTICTAQHLVKNGGDCAGVDIQCYACPCQYSVTCKSEARSTEKLAEAQRYIQDVINNPEKYMDDLL